jgi:hypothetical protein
VTNVTISVPGNQDESIKNNKIGSKSKLNRDIRPIENNAVKIVIKPLKPYQKYMMKSEGSILALLPSNGEAVISSMPISSMS